MVSETSQQQNRIRDRSAPKLLESDFLMKTPFFVDKENLQLNIEDKKSVEEQPMEKQQKLQTEDSLQFYSQQDITGRAEK